jgi:HlyD family secretion protein
VKQVAVRTGMRGSGLVQLTAGPPSGARVVASAASFLLDGDMVRPVEGAVQTAAGR